MTVGRMHDMWSGVLQDWAVKLPFKTFAFMDDCQYLLGGGYGMTFCLVSMTWTNKDSCMWINGVFLKVIFCPFFLNHPYLAVELLSKISCFGRT